MSHATAVCVLGMHRSGTSLLTRLLNVLGVSLGPTEQLMQAGADNPKGFWEHKVIREINDQILSAAGGSWDQPPAFADGWERSMALRDLGQRAASVINHDFGGMPMWGWKDPRTCLTLPFWQQLLPGLRYVVCLRHPFEVARSLERRNGFSIEKGVYLWLVYLEAILRATSPGNRCTILYEALIDNSRGELHRLSDFLGLPRTAPQESLLHKAQAFVDSGLRHHHRHADPKTAASDEGRIQRLLADAAALYEECDQHASAGVEGMVEQENGILSRIRPMLRARGIEDRQREKLWWSRRTAMIRREIDAFIPRGSTFILVDDGKLEFVPEISDRHILPLTERNGLYWGHPENDAAAIEELKRLKKAGAAFIVVAWSAFWWLDHYRKLGCYLRETCHRLVENDRLMVFDLASLHAGPVTGGGDPR
jgi:hypothetical protein